MSCGWSSGCARSPTIRARGTSGRKSGLRRITHRRTDREAHHRRRWRTLDRRALRPGDPVPADEFSLRLHPGHAVPDRERRVIPLLAARCPEPGASLDELTDAQLHALLGQSEPSMDRAGDGVPPLTAPPARVDLHLHSTASDGEPAAGGGRGRAAAPGLGRHRARPTMTPSPASPRRSRRAPASVYGSWAAVSSPSRPPVGRDARAGLFPADGYPASWNLSLVRCRDGCAAARRRDGHPAPRAPGVPSRWTKSWPQRDGGAVGTAPRGPGPGAAGQVRSTWRGVFDRLHRTGPARRSCPRLPSFGEMADLVHRWRGMVSVGAPEGAGDPHRR